MQRHLKALAATLPALPGDAGANSAFVRSSVAILVHLSELHERVVTGEDAAAATESAPLLRRLAALGGDTMSAMGRRLAASSGPTAEATLLSLCRISWTALSLQQQVDRHPSGRDSTDGMHWPGLLAWAAAALTAASVLLPVGGTRNHGQLTSAACGVVAAYFKYNSRLGADAVAGAQAHLPGALCVVLHTANWLAMPGHASFDPMR